MLPPNSGDKVLDEILRDLEERGVLYDLIDGVFRYCDEHAVLLDWEHEAVDTIRAPLTRHLRAQRALCVSCEGTPARAVHPSPWGYAGPRNSPKGHIRVLAPEPRTQNDPTPK
jgi:hypothetical protein